ncbi:MAG: LCP family protein [Eubacterium sp.]|nr:LCP family protein [Eubacterium sp.]
MNTKRRSNWYIYLITFVITGVLLFIVSQALLSSYYSSQQAQNVNDQQNHGTIFVPDSNYNFTMLLMLGKSIDATPDYYMTLTYRADKSQFTVMPYLGNSYIGGSTLKGAYNSGGAESVMRAISAGTGIEINKYIRFTASTAVQLFDTVGNTTLSVPKNIKYENDDHTLTIINSGTSIFSGKQLYEYLSLPDYGEKDMQYPCKVHATAISSFINQNFTDISESSLDEYMDFIIGFTSTNITEQDYLSKKAALLYSFDDAPTPCDYYIPYGDLSGNEYVISEGSVDSIKDIVNR